MMMGHKLNMSQERTLVTKKSQKKIGCINRSVICKIKEHIYT